MKKHAKLPSMHIDNCWVDLGERHMILTVHGSDHKKSKCIKYHKWIQEGQADGLNHVGDKTASYHIKLFIFNILKEFTNLL